MNASEHFGKLLDLYCRENIPNLGQILVKPKELGDDWEFLTEAIICEVEINGLSV